MPLTKTGNKVMSNMEKTYGSEKKAKEVFYASINAGKPGSENWHGKSQKVDGRGDHSPAKPL